MLPTYRRPVCVEKTPSFSMRPHHQRKAMLILLALTGWAVGFLPTHAQAAERPNVVLIMVDDLGYGELGCYGQQKIKTPYIDALAKQGMRFTNFYAGNAVCAPSRCSLMTGKHPGHAYIRSNGDPKHLRHLKEKFGWEFPGQNPIPAEEITMAEVFQKAGYATAAFGKWGLGHFGTTGDPNKQGFDLFYGFNCQRHAHNHYPRFLWRNNKKEIQEGNNRTLKGKTYSQDQFINEAIGFIKKNQKKPFFVYLPLAVPHLSIQVPDDSVTPYTKGIEEEDYKHKGYLKHPTPRAGYAGMITHMDDGIGKLMGTLKELELDEKTIVIFTSDNGPTYNRLGGSDSDFFNSASGLRGLKGSLYEGGIRVPLIVRWPKHVPAGQKSDLPLAMWDLFPTLAELIHEKTPKGVDGISFVPTVLGQERVQPRHEFLYWEFPSYGGQQAVRMGKWKGVRQNLMRGNAKGPDPMIIELYDLQKDEKEQHDVAKEHPQVVEKIRQVMKKEHTPSTLFPIPRLDKDSAS